MPKAKGKTKAKSSNPLKNLKTEVKNLPMGVRFSLWLLMGKAMGLPVDEILKMIEQQLAIAKRSLKGKRLRMTVAERLKMARLAKKIGTTFHGMFQWIISPEAFIKWAKRYQQRKANGSEKKKKKGRPQLSPRKEHAILRIYDSGITGLKRIRGEMIKCGLPVAKSTVRRILTRHGKAPTDSNRRINATWTQFWKNHAKDLVGIDFIQIPIGLFGRIVNCHILFGIEHDTRKVHILGTIMNPKDEWISNVIRSRTMDGDPLAQRKYWIMDNDGKYGPKTKALLGKKRVKTSIRAPDMNAIAERFVRSIKHECLDHIIFLSQKMLERHVREYTEHYNTERPHQGIGNKPIGEWTPGTGKIVCDQRLGGLLKSYRRAA